MCTIKNLSILLAVEDENIIWALRENLNKKTENLILDVARDDLSLMRLYQPEYYNFLLVDTSLEWCRETVMEIRDIEDNAKKGLSLILGIFRDEIEPKNKKNFNKYFKPFYDIGFNEIFCLPLSEKDLDIMLERYGPIELA